MENASAPVLSVCFAEIRQIIARLDKLPPVALEGIAPCGKLAEWINWLARAQGKTPKLDHLRLALFAGAHGNADNSTEKTRQHLTSLADENATLARALAIADADFQIYELDLNTPTTDFRTNQPALSEEEAAHAMTYGMMAVTPSLHLLALGGFGEGSQDATKALRDALPTSSTPLETLAYYGGRETCAILGAILAARLAKVPVLLDGDTAHAAAEVLARISPDSVSHCASAQAMEKEVSTTGLAAAFSFPRLRSITTLIPSAS